MFSVYKIFTHTHIHQMPVVCVFACPQRVLLDTFRSAHFSGTDGTKRAAAPAAHPRMVSCVMNIAWVLRVPKRTTQPDAGHAT